MKFIITIDTEADDQWTPGNHLNTHNLTFLPRFQALCERFGFPPTYLCTYEVIKSCHFKNTLSRFHHAGAAEIGAHLHPWSNPPFDTERTHRDKTAPRPYPSELPIDRFARKMHRLTDAIGQHSGASPRTYRAGRWGFSAEHVPVLEQLGYLADCSVTPMTTWHQHPGVSDPGPDFRGAPITPYFLSDTDLTRPGQSRLLEVPVTILSTQRMARYRWLSPTIRTIEQHPQLARVARKLRIARGPQWFRPWPYMTAGDLIRVYDEAQRRNLPLVEMMFHSSELMPAGSPFHSDEASIDRLYQKLEAVFAHAAASGAQGATLTDFASFWHVRRRDELLPPALAA